MQSLSMQPRKQMLLLSSLAVISATASLAWGSTNSDMPAALHVGSVTYLSGGGAPAQEQAMLSDAKQYPLELQFIWGRGAKETPVTASEWSIDNAAGHVVVAAHSGGPIILASLPNGRYTVRATYDGDTVARVVRVRKGSHDDVLLEWPD